MLPPVPRAPALATISLFPFGRAMIKLVSILILPPSASAIAAAEIRLLLFRSIVSSIRRVILPPVPAAVAAEICPPSLTSNCSATISKLPPVPVLSGAASTLI